MLIDASWPSNSEAAVTNRTLFTGLWTSGFWAIDNLAKRGDLDAAERRFQHMLAHANDLGLSGEEIDIASGAALGNFPQAFTHVGRINAAVAIERARE